MITRETEYGGESVILLELGTCQDYISRYGSAALQEFGPRVLNVIDLPILAPERIQTEQIHLAAVMFWLMEIEKTALLQFVERLAERAIKGNLRLPITNSGSKLLVYYRNRNTRFTRQERMSFYNRMFKQSIPFDSNQNFYNSFTRLIKVLSDIGRKEVDQPMRSYVVRLGVIARELLHFLAKRTQGIAGYAAKEIVTHVKQAREILQDPEIRLTFGNRTMWEIIRIHAKAILGHDVNPYPCLNSAKAGLTILSWLGEHASNIQQGKIFLSKSSPVISAAEVLREYWSS
jgi:hypothetical protein